MGPMEAYENQWVVWDRKINCFAGAASYYNSHTNSSIG